MRVMRLTRNRRPAPGRRKRSGRRIDHDESGDDEEDVDPDGAKRQVGKRVVETAMRQFPLNMEENDGQRRERAQDLDVVEWSPHRRPVHVLAIRPRRPLWGAGRETAPRGSVLINRR